MAGLDSNTRLLLYADGQNNGKEFIDLGAIGLIPTNNNCTLVPNDGGTVCNSTTGGRSVCSFPGYASTGYLSVPNTSSAFNVMASTSDSWTLDLWVKHDDNSPDEVYFCQDDATVPLNNRWAIYHDSTYGLVAEMYDGSGSAKLFIYTNSPDITDTNWHHVAFVKVNAACGLYLDGTQKSYGTLTATKTYSNYLAIGRLGTYAGGTRYFDGHMQKARVQKSNVFGVTVAGSDPGGDWMDNSGGDNGTITVPTSYTPDANTKLFLPMDVHDYAGDGGSEIYKLPEFVGDADVTTSTKKWGTGSFAFDGTGDWIKVVSDSRFDICASNSDDWTMDWQMYTASSAQQYLVDIAVDDSNRMLIYHNAPGENLTFYMKDGGSNNIYMTSNSAGPSSTWFHVAFIKVGSEYGWYINGTQTGHTSNTSTKSYSNPTLWLGCKNGGTTLFTGNMDEFRIQKSNYFGASPNSGLTDTITAPSAAYSYVAPPPSVGRAFAIIIA